MSRHQERGSYASAKRFDSNEKLPMLCLIISSPYMSKKYPISCLERRNSRLRKIHPMPVNTLSLHVEKSQTLFILPRNILSVQQTFPRLKITSRFSTLVSYNN